MRASLHFPAHRASVQPRAEDLRIEHRHAIVRHELRVDVAPPAAPQATSGWKPRAIWVGSALRVKLDLVVVGDRRPVGVTQPAGRPPALLGSERLVAEALAPLLGVDDKIPLDVGARVDEVVRRLEDCDATSYSAAGLQRPGRGERPGAHRSSSPPPRSAHAPWTPAKLDSGAPPAPAECRG